MPKTVHYIFFIISILQIVLSNPINYSIDNQAKIDYLQQVAINSEANIIATLASSLMGVSLTVDFYEQNEKINTTTTHIPQDFFISWVMQISGNGAIIALLEFNSQRVLIFKRNGNGQYQQVQKLETKGFAHNLALSKDAELLSLGDYKNIAELYKFQQESKSYELYQVFEITSDLKDQKLILEAIYECKISQDKKKLIFEGQFVNSTKYSQTKTAFLYALDQKTGKYVFDQNFYLNDFGSVTDIQMSTDAETLFIRSPGFPKIFKKKQTGEYAQLQEFKECWNNGVQSIELSRDADLAFVLCKNPIKTTIIYKFDQIQGKYKMITNVEKTNGQKILIADDGSKILVADLKQGTIHFITSQCEDGYLLTQGECVACQYQNCEAFNHTALILAITIPTFLGTIAMIVAIIICIKKCIINSKVSDTSSDDKDKNLTQFQVNETTSQNEDRTVYVNPLQKTFQKETQIK